MKNSVKICAILNEVDHRPRNLGYVLYYDKAQVFSIELDDTLTPMDVPLFFASFLKRNVYTLNETWSRKWVDQRIVPRNRQNLGAILKEAHLKEYHPYRLLLWGGGRSSQDDCRIVPAGEKSTALPSWFLSRMGEKITYLCPLSDGRILFAFADGMLRVIPIATQDAFWISPDGNAIITEKQLLYSNRELRHVGKALPLQMEDLKMIISDEVVPSQEAQTILNCSRQNLNYYTQKGMLTNILSDPAHRLYWRHELER